MPSQLDLPELQEFIHTTLDLWHVPGVAVTVVKEGETLLCEGFGQRDISAGLPATLETLFPIASCTKAFTAMCLALLVDEGKLDWDEPVRKYLPAFRLHDTFATERMTPRDLLCHRSGLPRHDFVWYAGSFNRREIFDRLQYLEPSADFRTNWQYQNMMYMVAGLLVSEVSGMSWESFVQQRIFDVLGMARTNTSTTLTQQDANHARPYRYRKGELKEIPFYKQDAEDCVGPAGTIVSTVADMAAWLKVHVNGGKANGMQFVSLHQLEEMHKPHIFIDDPQARQRFGFEFLSYGLGWFLRSVKGRVLVSHGGNINGFSSLTSFLPRHNLGVVVLSNGNGEHNNTPAVISMAIYDRLLGLERTDWNGLYKGLTDETLAAQDASHAQSGEQRKAAPPTHPIEDYLGEYEHPGYGVYAVRKYGDGLQLVANNQVSMPMRHYHYDIFEANWEQIDTLFKLSFSMDVKGNIQGFMVQVEEMVKEVFFARRADPRWSDPAHLQPFTGDYELQGLVLSVRMKGSTLTASLPGQNFELEPYTATEFKLKDQAGSSLAFQAGEDGVYNTAILTHPGAVFTAQRIAPLSAA